MKQSAKDKIFDIVNLAYVIFALLIVIYPLVFIVSASFSEPEAINAGRVTIFPVGFTLKGYKAVFENAQIWAGFRNSFIYASSAVVLNLLMTSIAAYPLSRKDFRFKNVFMYFFAFTMFFGGGLIPYYLVIKTLGMINTQWAIIIPSAMNVFYIILMRTYIQTSIPEELQEAANLDGCGDFKYLYKIVIPLSKPILAVIALYCAVSSWNTYFNALIFLSTPKLYPIQIILRNILVMNQFDVDMLGKIRDLKVIEGRLGLQALLKYSLIVVSTLPMLAIYPFVQKYFVKGITLGSIKG